MVSVYRKAHFNAAHRLYNPNWSDEKNNQVFGKCNNPNYHGHNYEIIVKVTGNVDPETGYVIDMKTLNNYISSEICDRFDHKNLNLDSPFFKNTIPTAENIVIVCWELLRKVVPTQLELKVTLYETDRNFVEYAG